MKSRRTTEFLNVDLDISGRSGLTGLVRALAPAMFSLRKTRTEATLELSYQPKDVGEAVEEIAKVVGRLAPDQRRMWDNCRSRILNIGIAAGREPHQATFVLPASIVARAVEVGADLHITVYGSSG